MLVDEHAIEWTWHVTECRVTRPLSVRPALSGGAQQFARRREVALPVAGLRHQHFGSGLRFSLGERHHVCHEPAHHRVGQRGAVELRRYFPENDAQRIGQVTDHPRRGHLAPFRAGIGRQAVEACEEFVAVG